MLNNLIVLNPKQMVLKPHIKQDKHEIDHRIKNTYYDKIIKNNIEEKLLKTK